MSGGGKRSAAQVELEEKEESISSILMELDEYSPLIPDSVTDYYLQKGTSTISIITMYINTPYQTLHIL